MYPVLLTFAVVWQIEDCAVNIIFDVRKVFLEPCFGTDQHLVGLQSFLILCIANFLLSSMFIEKVNMWCYESFCLNFGKQLWYAILICFFLHFCLLIILSPKPLSLVTTFFFILYLFFESYLIFSSKFAFSVALGF